MSRLYEWDARNALGAFKRLLRGMLSKPDHETELSNSNESAAEEEAAIERERLKRTEDKRYE